jgi:hypothetical protein
MCVLQSLLLWGNELIHLITSPKGSSPKTSYNAFLPNKVIRRIRVLVCLGILCPTGGAC